MTAPSEGRERARFEEWAKDKYDLRRCENQNCDDRENHYREGTGTNYLWEGWQAHGRSLEQERDALRKVVETLAGCMPDVIYVTDEKWSDQEPETVEGQEDNFVAIDFRKLVHKGDS